MYTQSFNMQDSTGLKSVAPTALPENPEAQARFDAKVDADGKIEPYLRHGTLRLVASATVKELRRDHGNSTIPCVVLTGWDGSRAVEFLR